MKGKREKGEKEKKKSNEVNNNNNNNNNSTNNNYLDLAKELRKLWNMRLRVIPIEIDSFGMVCKGLERGLEELEIEG